MNILFDFIEGHVNIFCGPNLTISPYQVTTGHQRKVVHSQQNHEPRLEDASNSCRSVDIAGNIDSRERPRRRYLSNKGNKASFLHQGGWHFVGATMKNIKAKHER